MKHLGTVIIVSAFLAGAYLAVLDEITVDWLPFTIVLLSGAGGVVLRRRALAVHAADTERVSSSTRQMVESLDGVVTAVSGLEAGLERTDVYSLPGKIDADVLPHLNRFVATTGTLKSAYGLQAFADIMAPYAGGERYLNRVWTSAADGYVDEATAYLPRARRQFEEAQRVLRDLQMNEAPEA